VRRLLTLLPPVFYGLRNTAPSPALSTLLREGSLGPRHFPVLMLVAANQPLSVGELAGKLGFGLATTSQLVADLDRAGLIKRDQDPADRRRTIVTVSDAGRPVIAQWYGARAAALRRALQQLSASERRTLSKALELIGTELARDAEDLNADEPSRQKRGRS
jgi:DNA-binding MarR family transcriptional regulator